MVLNMISTPVMVRLGKVYGNRMVDVRATNEKLRARARRIVQEVTGASEEEAARALGEADGNAKLAIFRLLSGLSIEPAKRALALAEGHLGRALREFRMLSPSAKEE